MPSAANAKSEKPASSEAMDNSPIRQVMTIIEHKIRNLEKRKSKLTSYRDLQKAGKELKSDQKVAVAKYDEVAQTLEFARDLSKQVSGVAASAEKEAKKQAKKDAWVRYNADANKIREVLLILDCLTQMGNEEAREDFLNGTNGAAKLTHEDLKILDDLYPEVTPKHEPNEEGQPGFHAHTFKAAEHLYSIIDGKPKEVVGTTYTHIKEIVSAVHECGYFDKVPLSEAVAEEEPAPEEVEQAEAADVTYVAPPAGLPPLPVPPAPAVVPAPAYPLRPMPPLTLQEIEHAYFTQQYQQQRPISEVIGSQNFFFLQESEIDSPTATPQPAMNQTSPPAPIPTQTFTNQHFVGMPGEPLPMPHFPPRVDFPVPPMHAQPVPHALPPQLAPPPAPRTPPRPASPADPADDAKPPSPPSDKHDDEWKENQSPDRENGERRTHGQGDGHRFRRYGRGARGAPNGFRGRGPFGGRQAGDYHARHDGYPRKDGYQPRQYDNYQPRAAKERDHYYGNGEAGEARENGGPEREHAYKGRGRARPPAPRAAPPRAPRQFARKPDKPDRPERPDRPDRPDKPE